MLIYRGHQYRALKREAKRRYEGPPREQGGTSIPGGAVKPLMQTIQGLISRGVLTPGESKIADIGAGAFSRNADALRAMGFDCYAYDPFNGTDPDGWTGVSPDPPQGQFDPAFTSYVLNVVPEHVEDEIIQHAEQLAPMVIHVTRNRDVRDMITDAIYRYMDGSTDKNAQLVGEFFLGEFADQEAIEAFDAGELYEEDMQELAEYGVPTSKGFQRIPVLDNKGYQKIRDTSGFKLYTKGI